MNRRAELLSNTDRKIVFEIFKLAGLCIVPMRKVNADIIEAFQKLQDPIEVKTEKSRKGIKELSSENKLILDDFIRIHEGSCQLDWKDDPIFKVLCEGKVPDVAFFCRKIAQRSIITQRRKTQKARSRGPGNQPVCKDCAMATACCCTQGEFSKASANLFAEWKHTTGTVMVGYKNIRTRQKELEAIVRQVDPNNTTTLRTVMRNRELDKNHETITKLMKELKGPIDVDDLFVCICCNPPQTAGGRILNEIHNGVKKNVNCLEGGVYVRPVIKEVTKPVEVEVTKPDEVADDDDVFINSTEETGETKTEGAAAASEPPTITPSECLHNHKELFLKLKKGPKAGQVLAEISSSESKGTEAVVDMDSIKRAHQCFCEDLLNIDCMNNFSEGGCFEVRNGQIFVTEYGKKVLKDQMIETVSAEFELHKCNQENIDELNSRRIEENSVKIKPENVIGNEDTVIVKSTLNVTITPKESRGKDNKRAGDMISSPQIVYVNPYKNSEGRVVQRPTLVGTSSTSQRDVDSESEDENFQGPPNYDNSNDNTDWVDVEDKACQTSDYSGDDYESDNYWLFNFPNNAQEIKILSQSHTFRKTVRIRKATRKVYNRPVEEPVNQPSTSEDAA